MRVLLVEDHLQLAESVAQALKSHGLTVDVLHDGVAADLALASEEYAVAVLDVGLPRMDGFEVLARLRGRGKTLPVLMLTARGEVKDRVHGLNLGADDYLAKPFELSELEARVKALLRRSVLGGEQLQRCGALVYDLGTRRFSLDEQPLTLTARGVAVCGRADRIDYHAGRRAWRILDYKTWDRLGKNEGLDRFIAQVKDVKLIFQTYGYSGN